jgi:predicted Zn-dependent protease
MRIPLRKHISPLVLLCSFAGLLLVNLIYGDPESEKDPCPATWQTYYKWKPNSKVYVTFKPDLQRKNSSVTDRKELEKSIQRQVLNAIEAWNKANKENGSNVEFVVGDPPKAEAKSQLMVIQQAKLQYGDHRDADADYDFDNTGNVHYAVISVDLTGTIDGNIRSFQATKPGYDTIFQKIAVHEIGHTMGLNHWRKGQEEFTKENSPFASVMNDAKGVNDYGNTSNLSVGNDGRSLNMPLEPTACDQKKIKQMYEFTSEPSPSPSPSPEMKISYRGDALVGVSHTALYCRDVYEIERLETCVTIDGDKSCAIVGYREMWVGRQCF